MKHSINEEVTMRHDLIEDVDYGNNTFIEPMSFLLGRNVTIHRAEEEEGSYLIKESHFRITDEMLEPSLIPESPELTHLPAIKLSIFAYKGYVSYEMNEGMDGVLQAGIFFSPLTILQLSKVKVSQEAIDVLKQMNAGDDESGIVEIYENEENGAVMEIFDRGEHGGVLRLDSPVGSRWHPELLVASDEEVIIPEEFKLFVDNLEGNGIN